MKRLFYFSGHQIIVYEWDKGRFISSKTFNPIEEDRDKFALYLQKQKNIPTRVLIDIIEEGFKRDKVPYAVGADRKSLFERTIKKSFRKNKYTHIETQGREKEGRMDLKVLISGLLNPEKLDYWMSLFEENHVPIEGIYSLPLVGELITKKLQTGKGNVLILTQESAGTLRQNYYVNGQLIQSRLSAVNAEQGIEFVHLLENEIVKTRHFLESTRVYKVQDGLDIFIIVSDQSEHFVKEHLSYQAKINYTILSLSEAFKKLKIKGKPISPYSDILFAHLLLEKPFYKNQYALTTQRSSYFHLLMNQSLKYTSIFLSAIFLFFAANALLEWFEQEQNIFQTRIETINYQNKLTKKQQELQTYRYSATTTKEVVQLFDKLKATTHSDPKEIFKTVSQALINNPNIILEKISWQVSNQPNTEISSNISTVNNASISFSKKDYLLLNLAGRITAFDGNYRIAIQTYRTFLTFIENLPNVIKVEDILSPFNLNSNSQIVGDSGTSAQVNRKTNASFKLKLVIGEKDAKI